ncbi:MAG: hypothetical protein A2583_12180 [Bdellovibrionales bacterium RIFOXYD1_FULL_53_11]|nr:MAG: hypothetical protein A2583_12180 [Bdellovibrionales bacterium RIFOXYD1_FULL_53_11]
MPRYTVYTHHGIFDSIWISHGVANLKNLQLQNVVAMNSGFVVKNQGGPHIGSVAPLWQKSQAPAEAQVMGEVVNLFDFKTGRK